MYGLNQYGTLIYSENTINSDDIKTLAPDLMKYLTSNYQDGENIRKLMKIIENEFSELNYYVVTLGHQRMVDKATWNLGLWEKELEIEYNPSSSIESRREIIKAKLRGRGTTTKQMIKNTAEAFAGGEVDVIEFPEEDYFVVKFIGVKGIPRNIQSFINMLEDIKPAHLNYEFKYSYTTCQMLKDWNVLCNDLKTKTCTDIKVYEKV